MIHIIRIIDHILGLDNVSGMWYAFWSGFFGDVGILGACVIWPYIYWKKHNCHVSRCIWWAKFPVDGTPYAVCKRHHPDVPNGKVTHQHILDAHQDHLDRQEECKT